MKASLAAGVIVVVLLLLGGCGSRSRSKGVPYSIEDVKRAFARNGVRLQLGPAPSSKHAHRLRALTPTSGVDSGIDLVFVDDSASFAELSVASFNATPDSEDERVGKIEVIF
jgi:hypothetical protein